MIDTQPLKVVESSETESGAKSIMELASVVSIIKRVMGLMVSAIETTERVGSVSTNNRVEF